MISIASAFSSVVIIFSLHSLNPPELQEKILTGLEHAYIDEYDTAMVYFQEVLYEFPENPAGYFFSAALLQLQMMDGCHYENENTYYAYLQQAIEKAQAILEQEDNIWARFYLGSCYTYRAVFEGLKKNYYETFTYGVKGGKILKEIIARDSTFYDAYLGAGTYEYFWARAARYLPILNLGGGDVPEAIRKVRCAAMHSVYLGPTALSSLAFIFGEEKDYPQANMIIDELLTAYPSGRTFLWSKADLEMKQEHYESAAVIYRSLHDTYRTLESPNYANCAQCKLFEGTCYYELKKFDAAQEVLKTVISYKMYADRYPIIKNYCREAYSLLTRLY